MHSVAARYPEHPTYADRARYKAFYESIVGVLPCEKCRVHHARHLGIIPIDDHLGSRDALFEWTVRVHNKVNAMLGKSSMDVHEAMSRSYPE
jgi:hypothetical protein